MVYTYIHGYHLFLEIDCDFEEEDETNSRLINSKFSSVDKLEMINCILNRIDGNCT